MKHFNFFNSNNISNKSCENIFKPRKKTNNSFEKKIFQIISYIYYYEKEIKMILNKKDKDFYLINYDWLIDFKKIFEYENNIKRFSKIKKELNFNNLENQINKYFFDKNNKITSKDKNEYKKLLNVNYFIPEQNREEELTPKIVSYYIIPYEIMDKIKNCFFEEEKLNISPIESLSLVEDKIIIKNKNIFKFGNLDSSFKLTLEYIFNYNSDEIANSEIKYSKKVGIKDYINERKCTPDNYEIQTMKKTESGYSYKEIGKLKILKNIETKQGEIKNELKRKSNVNKNKDYFTQINTRIKNERNKTPNNYMIKNRSKILFNTNNNLKSVITNTKNDNEIHSSQININNNMNDDKEEKTIEEKMIEGDNKDKIQILEINMNKKFSNLSKIIEDKYNKIRNYFEEKYKIINEKNDEIINYNKMLNEKIDKTKKEDEIKLGQSQNEIIQLKKEIKITKDKLKEKEIQEEINMKTIDDLKKEIDNLKQKNKMFGEEREKNKKQNENNSNTIQEKDQQLFKHNKVDTNLVLERIREIKLVGLKNIGQISFINSVLQCLFQIKPLINYFKNQNYINNNHKLASAFQELINQMQNLNAKSLNPTNLIKTFKEINNSGKIINFDSIYNFLESILNKLHDELKNQKNQNNYSLINNRIVKLSSFEFESYKKEIKNESIITDLFQGVNEEIIQCPSNNIIFGEDTIFKFNPFLFLSFDLNRINSEQNIIKIFDCFINMKREQIYYKEEYCQICDKNCNLCHRTRISLCPEYLIIMLNYGNENNNYNFIKVNFEEILDMTNFTKFENETKNDKNIYNINGIITKVKNNYNNFNFKYIAYCKNPDNGNWYRFNDEEIKNIGNNIQNQIFNCEIPLILFYKLIK